MKAPAPVYSRVRAEASLGNLKSTALSTENPPPHAPNTISDYRREWPAHRFAATCNAEWNP